jgi:hypothetical protein
VENVTFPDSGGLPGGIAAENLLGTKYINIKKGRSGDYPAWRRDQKPDTREFDDVVQQGYSTRFLNGIFKKLDGILTSSGGQRTIGASPR